MVLLHGTDGYEELDEPSESGDGDPSQDRCHGDANAHVDDNPDSDRHPGHDRAGINNACANPYTNADPKTDEHGDANANRNSYANRESNADRIADAKRYANAKPATLTMTWRKMCKRSLILLIIAGVLATLFLAMVAAIFTGSATVTNNTFTTGSLVISTNPTSAFITYTNMAPGDQVTRPLTVTNSGTIAFSYAMTSTVTNADGKGLMNPLQLQIRSGVTDCSDTGFGVDGTPVYSNTLSSAALGDSSQPNASGNRWLAAGASEVLCFHTSLPLTTTNAYQSATTTATFIFNAVSNPATPTSPPTLTPTNTPTLTPTATATATNTPTATPTVAPVNLLIDPSMQSPITGWTSTSAGSFYNNGGYGGNGHFAFTGSEAGKYIQESGLNWSGGNLKLSGYFAVSCGNNLALVISGPSSNSLTIGVGNSWTPVSVSIPNAAAGSYMIQFKQLYGTGCGYMVSAPYFGP